jgi:hypothetical protein
VLRDLNEGLVDNMSALGFFRADFLSKKLAGERIFFVNDARTNPTL